MSLSTDNRILGVIMNNMNAMFFAGASNMSQDQIQKLFSPVVPGKYTNSVVFAPCTNPQDAIFRAIEALRNVESVNEKPIVTCSPTTTMLAHG